MQISLFYAGWNKQFGNWLWFQQPCTLGPPAQAFQKIFFFSFSFPRGKLCNDINDQAKAQITRQVHSDDQGQAEKSAAGPKLGSVGHTARQGQESSLFQAMPRARDCSSTPKERVVSLGWGLSAALHGHDLPVSPSRYMHMWEKTKFTLLQQKVTKFVVVCNSMWKWWSDHSWHPTNPPLPRTGQNHLCSLCQAL